jgi:RNA polymerase sigma factor (sigma-70 family)
MSANQEILASWVTDMAYAARSFVGRIESVFAGGSVAGLADRHLLERFTAGSDAAGDAAFAALVARYGPMVLHVCRQFVADRHLAEDVFQAVFLVLARKALSIRDPDRLGAWLHRVAILTARKAKVRLDRRRRNEDSDARRRPGWESIIPVELTAQPAEQSILAREQAEALHEEIDRLPHTFRSAVVLCYFEGLALDEAAHRLRWPVGTLRSRLARARDKLRRGLTRRGFALSGTAMAALLRPCSARASVSSLPCETTARAAVASAARLASADGTLSASAAAMAQEVLRTMLLHKLRLAAMSVLFLAVVAAGAASQSFNVFARSREGEPPGEPLVEVTRTEPRPLDAPGPPDEPRPSEQGMTIAGRVLDPEGRPLPNARIAVLSDRKRLVSDLDGQPPSILTGMATGDADGRFGLKFPAIPASRLARLRLIATAPGRGLGVVELKTDAANQETSIALAPEKPVEGRLVDVQGQPAAGVVVRVARLRVRGGYGEVQPYDATGSPSLWPSPTTTDADGRFRLLGLGPNAPATFEVEDPRFARQAFAFHIEGPATKKAEQTLRHGTTVTLQSAQALDIRVIHADDARPVAGAGIDVRSFDGRGSPGEVPRARTDGQGRARVIPWPGDRFWIVVHAPEGEPYLPTRLDVNWPKGAVQHTVEVKLGRGVLVRGLLIEERAGTPVAGGGVGYVQTRRGNPRPLRLPEIQAVSGPDGAFTRVAPTGPGHLLVQGPSADYLHLTTSNVEMGVGLRPSFRMYPDAHAVLDIKDGEAPRPLRLRLQRGVTVAGRVVAPDGKPVTEAFAFGRSYEPYGERPYPMTAGNGTPPQVEVKDGRFEIPGCDPERPVTFYFLDLKDHLGGTAEISGRLAAKGPITVRLRPTASASILLKRPDGKVPDYYEARSQLAGLRVVITPGPDWEEINKNIDVIPGDFAYQINLDFDLDNLPHPGPDGRMTLRNLIPGAPYRFRGRDFTPEPGQTVDLGEVVVEGRRR